MLKIDELVQDDDGVNRTILITFLSLRCANISNFIYMEGNLRFSSVTLKRHGHLACCFELTITSRTEQQPEFRLISRVRIQRPLVVLISEHRAPALRARPPEDLH